MLHEAQRTSAPSAVSVSISTAVCTVMCRLPAMRAPFSGWPRHIRRAAPSGPASRFRRCPVPCGQNPAIKKQIKAADNVSAWLEAVQIAGFTEAEANRFFGRPDPGLARGLGIRLRPPAEVRGAFIARHEALLALSSD
jgi:hypothetical protein